MPAASGGGARSEEKVVGRVAGHPVRVAGMEERNICQNRLLNGHSVPDLSSRSVPPNQNAGNF